MKPKLKIQELPPDYEYVWKQYGATPKKVEGSVRRALREIAADRKAGRLIEFTGKLPKPTKAEKVNKRRK